MPGWTCAAGYHPPVPAMTCVDLYAGAGGATQGLRNAGFAVVGAVENDPNAAASYAKNHVGVVLAERDSREVCPYSLRRVLGLRRGELDLLKACPPCQGFSSLARGPGDAARDDLVLDVARFVDEFLPKAILLENVPGLQADRRLTALGEHLEAGGYALRRYRVDATTFGVPQRRKRLIVLALSGAGVELPDRLEDGLPATFDRALVTAGQALARLERTSAPNDPLDRHRRSNPTVQARIAAVPVNGTRFDLPREHWLECHTRIGENDKGVRNAGASYGRVRADAPAPTMTTRCTTPACGSFIHPTLHRGLTLREAAILQTFPLRYSFVGGYESIERQIGNAVPVRMAYALGVVVRNLLLQQQRRRDGRGASLVDAG